MCQNMHESSQKLTDSDKNGHFLANLAKQTEERKKPYPTADEDYNSNTCEAGVSEEENVQQVKTHWSTLRERQLKRDLIEVPVQKSKAATKNYEPIVSGPTENIQKCLASESLQEYFILASS